MHLDFALASHTALLIMDNIFISSVMSIVGFHEERRKVKKGLCCSLLTGEKPKGKVDWVFLVSVSDSASSSLLWFLQSNTLFQPLLQLRCGSCCFWGFHKHLQIV